MSAPTQEALPRPEQCKVEKTDSILEKTQHKLKFVQHYFQGKEEYFSDPVWIGCEAVISEVHDTLGDMRDHCFTLERELGQLKEAKEVSA